MAATITGYAAVYGVTGLIQYYGIGLPGNVIMQDVLFTDNFTAVPRLNAEGDTVAVKVSNKFATSQITLVPVGFSPTINNTIVDAALTVYIPTPYALVRLTSFPGYTLNGFWNYSGGATVRQTIGGFTVVTLNLIRYEKVDARNLAITLLST